MKNIYEVLIRNLKKKFHLMLSRRRNDNTKMSFKEIGSYLHLYGLE